MSRLTKRLTTITEQVYMKLELTGAAALIILALAVMLLGSSEVSSSRTFSKESAGKKALSSTVTVKTEPKVAKPKIDTVAENTPPLKESGIVTVKGTNDSEARIESLEKLPN